MVKVWKGKGTGEKKKCQGQGWNCYIFKFLFTLRFLFISINVVCADFFLGLNIGSLPLSCVLPIISKCRGTKAPFLPTFRAFKS